MKVLQRLVVNMNMRSHPTTFVLVPCLSSEKSSAGTTLSSLFSALSDPKGALKGAIDSKVREVRQVALLCERCYQTVAEEDFYKISSPTETVARLLPLAKVGMKAAYVANGLSGLGRVFGLPTPVLSKEALSAASKFIDGLDRDSLEDFPEMQRRVQLLSGGQGRLEGEGGGEAAAAGGGKAEAGSGGVEPLEGYCAREFGNFLKEVDKPNTWGGLSRRVDEGGEVFFACRECCAGR
jgi:hypothetical protein